MRNAIEGSPRSEVEFLDIDLKMGLEADLMRRANARRSERVRARVKHGLRSMRDWANERMYRSFARGHVAIGGIGLAAYSPKISPNPKGLPGLSAAEKLVGGAVAFFILGCVAAMALGFVQMALGNKAGNYQQSADGKSKVMAAGVGLIGIGALGAIAAFALKTGSTVS